jgi:G3E family GTPase
MSKTDLVSSDEVESLRERLLRMNPRAPIKYVHMGQVPIKDVLDIRGFNLNAILEIDPEFLAAEHPDAAKTKQHKDRPGTTTAIITTIMTMIMTMTTRTAMIITIITTTMPSRRSSFSRSSRSIRPSWRTTSVP